MSDERAASFVEAAHRYASLGWALIRLDGKTPHDAGWEKAGPEEAGFASGRWATWGRKHNLGVVLGPSALAVLDVDRDDADAACLALLRADELPETPVVRTGSGRLHVYFRGAGGLAKHARDGFELRVGAHQCVAPPSVHPDTGKPYEWLPGRAPWETELAELPSSLVEFFAAAAAPNGAAAPVGDVIAAGARNAKLTSLAGSMRRRGMSEAEIVASLLVANRDRCRPPLPEDEVRAVAASVGRYEPQRLAEPERALDLSKPAAVPMAVTEPGSWLERGSDLLSGPDPGPTPWLVETLVVDQAILALYGPAKAGKTWLFLELARATVTGAPAFGAFAIPNPGPVIFVLEESGRAALHRRLDMLSRGNAQRADLFNDLHLSANRRVRLNDPRWQEALIVAGQKIQPRAIFLDPLVRLKGSNVDEDRQREMGPVLDFMRDLRDASGATVAFAHHVGHEGGRMRGSSDLAGYWESSLQIVRQEQKPAELRSEHREAEASDPFAFKVAFDRVTRSCRFEVVEGALRERVRAFLDANPAASANSVDEAIPGQRIQQLVKELRPELHNAGGSASGNHLEPPLAAAPEQVVPEGGLYPEGVAPPEPPLGEGGSAGGNQAGPPRLLDVPPVRKAKRADEVDGDYMPGRTAAQEDGEVEVERTELAEPDEDPA